MAAPQAEKAERFRALHQGEPFVIPNPWDAGSARILAGLGFRALATTSAGFALTLGRDDGEVTLEELAAHTSALAGATDLPLSVDIENGFGPTPQDAARAVTRIAEAGAVGGSIEDYGASDGIYEIGQASERIAAAREAADALDFPFTLTGRAENFFRGNPDLDDTIRRLLAYEGAGADVLYAPGMKDLEQIRKISEATTKPLNVLGFSKLSFEEAVDAGAQRVSLGSALAAAAYAALAEIGAEAHGGDFSSTGGWGRITPALGGP